MVASKLGSSLNSIVWSKPSIEIGRQQHRSLGLGSRQEFGFSASGAGTPTDSGYEYRGVSYRSLSEIARKITGTRWSGPAFFGLKKTNSVVGHPDE
jgi:hypothetical protein